MTLKINNYIFVNVKILCRVGYKTSGAFSLDAIKPLERPVPHPIATGTNKFVIVQV